MLLYFILLFYWTTPVQPGLEDLYKESVKLWAPYHAFVGAVRWCEPAECTYLDNLNLLGYWDLDEKYSIIINVHGANYTEWEQQDLLLTLAHEYGHALGLKHVKGYAVMNPDWYFPVAYKPTEIDWNQLRSLYKP
jgi:hypothetical protein